MTVIKHQHPFDLNWQAAGPSQAVLLTKVFTGGPNPSYSSFFFLSLSSRFYLYISFSLITDCTAHSTLLTMTQKKGKESGSKEGLKTAGNPQILKVASGLLSCSPPPPTPFGSIVCNCNRTSGGKIKSLFCYQNTET